MKQEIKDLTDAGLTQGEAKVYYALVQLGSSTVGPIIKKSKVANSNVYQILERLIEKGIVSYTLKKKVKYFNALKTDRLLDYLEKQKKEIEQQQTSIKKISKKLENLKNFGKQHAEVFTGTKGLRSAYEKYLSTEKGDLLYFNSFNKKQLEKADSFYFNLLELWKGRKAKGISDEKYKKSLFYKKHKKLLNLKFAKFPIPGNIDIGEKNIMIVSWEEPIVTILINSEPIAKSFRKYFLNAWNSIK